MPPPDAASLSPAARAVPARARKQREPRSGQSTTTGMSWSPRYWAHRLLTLKATPNSIAIGAAIGIFIAFTPTIGIQSVIAAIVAFIVRVSKPAAIIPVWISNPFTMVPIFAFTYWVGAWFWPGQTISDLPAVLHAILDNPETTFLQQTREMLNLGGALFGPLWIGGILVGAVAGAITYPIVKWAVVAYKRHRLHKRRVEKAGKQENRKSPGLSPTQ